MLEANQHISSVQQDDPDMEMMVDDEEDDGLPQTCEANDILIMQKSSDRLLDSPPILPEPNSSQFQLAKKYNSKSRSFAEPHQAGQSIKLFGNSFGKGSMDVKNHYSSFLSVNNPDTVGTKKLSSRSNNSGRLRRQLIKNTGNADCLSQVSEGYDHTMFPNSVDKRNEVDLELIELMHQSQSQGLMDEGAVIERFSGINCNEANTQRQQHGYTPVSFRQVYQVNGGFSAGKTSNGYKSYMGAYSGQASHHDSTFRQMYGGFSGHANNSMFQPQGGPFLQVP